MSDGGFFGETALLQPEHKRITTSIALEVCEIFRLDRREFHRLVTPGSDFYNRLKQFAYKRIQDMTVIENYDQKEDETTKED